MFYNDNNAKIAAEDHIQDLYREVKANRLAREVQRGRGSQNSLRQIQRLLIQRLLKWLKPEPTVQIEPPARPVTGPLAADTWH
jgi:hypothetical protein